MHRHAVVMKANESCESVPVTNHEGSTPVASGLVPSASRAIGKECSDGLTNLRARQVPQQVGSIGAWLQGCDE